ncbi:hypothetical protein B296_00009861 [Ensete ventricosum]|uniref:Uncharacterized protein n=1 Tax=Ensete ventricosum TaxID=4639 RepID=A0A427AJZ8_ENSVE|nr:hypothetical protein B296_00009861 [Ensete ventricosum]
MEKRAYVTMSNHLLFLQNQLMMDSLGNLSSKTLCYSFDVSVTDQIRASDLNQEKSLLEERRLLQSAVIMQERSDANKIADNKAAAEAAGTSRGITEGHHAAWWRPPSRSSQPEVDTP